MVSMLIRGVKDLIYGSKSFQKSLAMSLVGKVLGE